MELVYKYDKTWEGLLTLIFEVFERKETPNLIEGTNESSKHLFSFERTIFTDEQKAKRVRSGIRKKSLKVFRRIYWTFLSEKQGRELICVHLSLLIFKDSAATENDYRNQYVLKSKQIEKEISREIHRMHAFVRFQKGQDDIWYAFIRPDFNVLPLIGKHFKDRYADQKWVIYDLKRKTGLFYNLESVSIIQIDFYNQIKSGQLPSDAISLDEKDYQNLWKNYFDSVNIKERENMKLHIQHVPKRYWDLMTEID